MKRWMTMIVAAGLCSFGAAAAARTFEFGVWLDDTPIGEHRFAIDEREGRRVVASDARFTVKLGFVPVYRYRHNAREIWRDDCLVSLNAETEDGGKRRNVTAALEGDQLRVDRGEAAERIGACVMTFAYWNPAILEQSRLLNPQTGRYDPVRIESAGRDSLEIGGREQAAERFRIVGAGAAPIDVWYAGERRQWVGLETVVDGGRRLRYRLR